MSEVLIKPALLRDIPALLSVINGYAAKGIMLPRTELEMAENIRDFVAAFDGDRIIGCGALHIYTPQSAEVRSLAVLPETKGTGIGRRIVESLIADAQKHEMTSVFAFTYSPGFFRKLGFEELDRDELPLKAWKDCLRCPKFQACDEIAMRRWLVDTESARVPDTAARTRPAALEPLIQLHPLPASHS